MTAATWTRESIEALGSTTTVETTADILSVSASFVYRLIKRGEWMNTRVLRLGRCIRIPVSDLVELLYPSTKNGQAASKEGVDAA